MVGLHSYPPYRQARVRFLGATRSPFILVRKSCKHREIVSCWEIWANIRSLRRRFTTAILRFPSARIQISSVTGLCRRLMPAIVCESLRSPGIDIPSGMLKRCGGIHAHEHAFRFSVHSRGPQPSIWVPTFGRKDAHRGPLDVLSDSGKCRRTTGVNAIHNEHQHRRCCITRTKSEVLNSRTAHNLLTSHHHL